MTKHQRYDRSEKGRARKARYEASPKGRARRRRDHLRRNIQRREAFIQRNEEALR